MKTTNGIHAPDLGQLYEWYEGLNMFVLAPTSTFPRQWYNSITMYNITTNYFESVETGLTFQMDTK